MKSNPLFDQIQHERDEYLVLTNQLSINLNFLIYQYLDIDKLKNLDLWIVGLLRQDTHPAHAGFDQIMDLISYIKPKQTIFTHMTALLDEKELITKCPPNVKPGYDGMIIDL